MKKLLPLIAGIAMASAAQAVPVQWTAAAGGNDHWYDFVGASSSWTDANAAATAATYFDGSQVLNGYLATITSATENAFLGTLANDGWIGASDDGHEADWRWVGGPEAGQTFWLSGTTTTYSSWNGGEPNNAGGENFAHYQGGNWNDLPNNSNRGYFVEYSATAQTAVPEPAMLGLFGVGVLGLITGRRRKA